MIATIAFAAFAVIFASAAVLGVAMLVDYDFGCYPEKPKTITARVLTATMVPAASLVLVGELARATAKFHWAWVTSKAPHDILVAEAGLSYTEAEVRECFRSMFDTIFR